MQPVNGVRGCRLSKWILKYYDLSRVVFQQSLLPRALCRVPLQLDWSRVGRGQVLARRRRQRRRKDNSERGESELNEVIRKTVGRGSETKEGRAEGGRRWQLATFSKWKGYRSSPLLPLRIETSGEHNGGYIFLTFEDGERGTMVTNGGIWIFWNKPRQKTRGQKNRGGENR